MNLEEESVLSENDLLEACKNGNMEIFNKCLEQNVPLHNERAHFKDTAIFQCCYNGHVTILKSIVEHRANILFQPVFGEIGACPMIEHTSVWVELQKIAAEKNGLLIANCLFYVACIFQNLKIVKFLSLKMASSNIKPIVQSLTSLTQPFYVTCVNNDLETARFLFEMNMAKITQAIVVDFPDLIHEILHSSNYVKPCCSIKTSRKKARATTVKNKTISLRTTVKRSTRNKETVKKDKVSISWDGLRLFTIQQKWFDALQNNGKEISNINISGNNITNLPTGFFRCVPNLEELNVARNSLLELPSDGIQSVKLINLIAAQNQLTQLPVELFLNRTIEYLDVSVNGIDTLPSVVTTDNHKDDFKKHVWKCNSLETLKCSGNLLQQLPHTMKGANGLVNLHLRHNRFTDFSFVWKCPLTHLDLSHNKLEKFSGSVDTVWSRTLHKLALSRNNLRYIPESICHLQNVQHLNISYNSLSTLPHPNVWKCKMLSFLNLSYNELSNSKLCDGFIDIESGELEFDRTCELPEKLFCRTLQSLNLSNNRLDEVPSSVCHMKLLRDLDISNNPDLHCLPSRLGLLNNLSDLCLTNLDIENIPFRLDNYNHAEKVLPFLRAEFRKSVPFSRMKLMVVGLQGRGKTSLVAAIQGKPLPADISTVGISIEQFTLPMKSLYIDVRWIAPSEPEIVFSTWDLAGQQVYYATHQCFLTSNTLYLVVFNVTHGNEGIESLKPWLLNIQARAPNSQCVIVGTHSDCLPKDYKEAAIEKYKNDIINKYEKQGYPYISGYVFVSSVTQENIDELRKKIYSTATVMIRKGSAQSDYRKMAPLSYLQLYDRIIKETHQRRANLTPPVLTTDEMLKLAQENPDNDIFEGEELHSAARFLHENGILLHFDDPLRGLNTVFFIDPSWLIDMLALVVTVKERNPYPFVNDGYIDKDKMMLILKDPRLPDTFVPQYLRLLERFEIALSIDDARFLIPCMLPMERPDMNDKMQHVITDEEIDVRTISNERNLNYLTRNYHMNYIPAGFWSRLIARLVIAVQEWDSQVTSIRCEKNTHSSYTVWKEGMFIMYDDGYFLVESFSDDMIDYKDKNLSKQGMAITVWSKTQNFKVMGFIVDHVDMLLSDWYPGLAEGVDEFQKKLIQRMISCPICSLRLQQYIVSDSSLKADYIRNNFGSIFRDPTRVQQFSLPMCATATIEHQAICCVKHPDQLVPLELVIPDITLTDIPKEYKIDQEQFDFDPREGNRLGVGGAAKVYKALYKGEKVAVKQFHSQPIKKRENPSKSLQVFTPDDDYEYEDEYMVIRGVWELRQEVLILCTLQHPNVIQFLGVCHSPLCFVIEFAPMGSLQDAIDQVMKKRRLAVIESPNKETEWFPSIFEKRLTRNIALQVIEAIKYLHSFEIIYRDLKADNVLVWSLNEEDTVNVKLSDYGIAAFATPQGAVGNVGTAGFQAPEIKYGSPYDEKVDIFSYGMWLYQLLSGYTPYHEYPSDIKKALMSGIRPNINKDCVKSKIPNIELLMKNCWHHSPIRRPTASDISLFLKYPDVCMMESIYPPSTSTDTPLIHDVTCFTHWNVKHKDSEELCEALLIWSGCGDDRKYQVIDATDESVKYEGVITGSRVTYACQVEENVWLANQDKEIEVYGQFKRQPPKILWKFKRLEDEVIMMSTNRTENFLTVFACTASGTLNILKKFLVNGDDVTTRPLLDTTEEDILSYEEDRWANQQVVKLNNIGAPSKCMIVTNNNTELWVGSGSTIVVVNLLNDVHHISAQLDLSSSNAQTSIVSCMVSDGGNYVWSCNWRSTFIIKWDVRTRIQVCEYQCNVNYPLDQVLYTEVGSNSDRIDFTNNDNSKTVENVCEEECTAANDAQNTSIHDNTSHHHLPRRSNSVLHFPSRAVKRQWRCKSVDFSTTTAAQQQQQQQQQQDSSSLVLTSSRRIRTMDYVNNTLWVSRAIGDILVLNVDAEADFAREAQVLTVLVDDNLELMGGYARSVHSIVAMETKIAVLMRQNARFRQRIVRNCSFRASNDGGSKTDNYQLLVYDVWAPEEIVSFKRNTKEIMCNS